MVSSLYPVTAMSERVSDPYGIKKLRRAFDDSQNRSGQVVGLPHVTIEASLVAHALASYDALSRDVAATRAELVTMTAMWGERVRDYDESRAELDEALKYAHHTPECDCMQDELPCTCGLNALLRKVGK